MYAMLAMLHQALALSTTLFPALLAWSTSSLPMADIPNRSWDTPMMLSGLWEGLLFLS